MTEPNLLDLLKPSQGPSHRHAPSTSAQAARDNAPRSGTQRARVLLQIAGRAGTDEQIGKALKLGANSVRPRRLELLHGGFIADSGLKDLTETGSWAVVWRVTEKGRELAGMLA